MTTEYTLPLTSRISIVAPNKKMAESFAAGLLAAADDFDDATTAPIEATVPEAEPDTGTDFRAAVDTTLAPNHPMRVLQETRAAAEDARRRRDELGIRWPEPGWETCPYNLAKVAADNVAERARLAAQKGLQPGDLFTVVGVSPWVQHNGWWCEEHWLDGEPIIGTYTFLGRFRALRSDGIEVKMPRSWSSAFDWYREAAVPEPVVP
jgi:hypothetical protein